MAYKLLDDASFDAIVGPSGTGDYATLGAAVSAGAKKIFVRTGTYNEPGSITLKNSLKIVGESFPTDTHSNSNGDGVYLNFGSNPAFEYYGTNDTSNDLTISVLAGDRMITMPSGWLGESGDICRFTIGSNNFVAMITNRTGDVLELDLPFPISGDVTTTRRYSDVINSIHLENFLLGSTADKAIEMAGVYGFTMRSVWVAGEAMPVFHLLDAYRTGDIFIKHCRGAISIDPVSNVYVEELYTPPVDSTGVNLISCYNTHYFEIRNVHTWWDLSFDGESSNGKITNFTCRTLNLTSLANIIIENGSINLDTTSGALLVLDSANGPTLRDIRLIDPSKSKISLGSQPNVNFINCNFANIIHKTSSNYTTDILDSEVFVDTSGAITVTLGTATVKNNKKITIKDYIGNASENNITVATEGSELIDGNSTATISTDYGKLSLICDGTDWFTI